MVNLGPDFIILNHDFAVKHCLLLFVIEAGGGDLLDLVKKRRLPYPENIFRTDSLLLQNYMSRANFFTFTASCTFVVINVCTEIRNCDCL